MLRILKKFYVDTYMLLLIATIALAVFLPVSGAGAKLVSQVGVWAVALLFFLYGAKLKSQVVLAGVANWRLQLLVIAMTFVFFPLMGLALAFIARDMLPEDLITGFLFLCILPSTVQSSIALTAMARGNVPASICAASLSSLLGVVVTPALAVLVLESSGLKLDANAAIKIGVQLLLPFILGQILRPWIGGWIERHKMLTTVVDRGSILLIVYSAFSAGVIAGIWGKLDGPTLSLLIGLDLILLGLAMLVIRWSGSFAGLAREDRVSFLFCGSQKSLATGVPMATILFAGHSVGPVVLPLMLYHQFQLFISAAIAQRYAADEAAQPLGIESRGA